MQTQKTELDKKIYDVQLKKRTLCVQEENNEITERKFKNQFNKLNTEWRELTDQKIEELYKNLKQKEQKIDNHQQELKEKEEKIKKENRKSAGRKVTKNSFSSLILKALMHPKINSEEKVIAMVKHWKNGGDDNNLRIQVRNIVSNIKNQKQRRFEGYSWDKDKYLVVNNRKEDNKNEQ